MKTMQESKTDERKPMYAGPEHEVSCSSCGSFANQLMTLNQQRYLTPYSLLITTYRRDCQHQQQTQPRSPESII